MLLRQSTNHTPDLKHVHAWFTLVCQSNLRSWPSTTTVKGIEITSVHPQMNAGGPNVLARRLLSQSRHHLAAGTHKIKCPLAILRNCQHQPLQRRRHPLLPLPPQAFVSAFASTENRGSLLLLPRSNACFIAVEANKQHESEQKASDFACYF